MGLELYYKIWTGAGPSKYFTVYLKEYLFMIFGIPKSVVLEFLLNTQASPACFGKRYKNQ
jgi:hypothetical protein